MNRFDFLNKIKFGFRRPSIGRIVFWVITLALSVGAFIAIRDFTSCFKMADLPGMPLPACSGGLSSLPGFVPVEGGTPAAPLPDAPPTPVIAPEAALPPAWDGASRINILFFGLDYRDWEANQGPPRSDTMILFTIDPIAKSVGMLSIPRDLWVNIPGFGYSRINTAYPSGEGERLPGGGAGLVMKTVENLLGVPVHYYAQVDFNTFVEFIDYIGGVDVWVEESLLLDIVGKGNDKFRVNCCGYRHMTGARALAYARTRKTEGGDIDRAHRQQLVIYAIKKKVFDSEVFPTLIQNAPALYAQFQSGIHTNMAFEDALKLAMLGKDISIQGANMRVIDISMVTLENVTLDGKNASVMKPMPDKIRILRDEIFTSTGPLSPLAVPLNSTDMNLIVQAMRAEEARVRIVDGTFTPGLDQRAGVLFQSQGMYVTEVGPAPDVRNTTMVVVYGPKLYTVRYLQSTFGVSSSQIRFSPDPNSTVDVEIQLGADLAGYIP